MAELQKENERPKARRKKEDDIQNVRKKRKVEPLINWGSGGQGKMNEESETGSWILQRRGMRMDLVCNC